MARRDEEIAPDHPENEQTVPLPQPQFLLGKLFVLT